MRAFVDENKCNTAGICVKELPEVFRFKSGNKKAYVRMDPIPLNYQKRVLEIARKCPVNAIIVEEEEDTT